MLLVVLLISACNKQPDFEYSPARTPAEELATFQLVPGLRIELVAGEPLVEDPVVITFDEDGRLWVVEMRGFMPDIDGNGEDARIGRISILWDDDEDGLMDRRTTFMDSLVLPRSLAIVKGGALVAENKPLWFVEDTDGDLKADRKTLIDPEYGGSGLPEHSGNGLWRGLDNWYYNAKSRVRFKRINNQWVQDSTEFRGQWGLSHDDKGRLYYNYNWSQLHADLVPPNYLSRNPNHTSTSGIDVGLTVNRSVYPIRPTRAVNRGYIPGNLNEEGKMLEFTSASAPLVYRGTGLPAEFHGDVFVCEPSGNLIKRNVIHENGFSLTSTFAYPDHEFLASTDERFRPVSLATGPDGALYVVDMYRGLIQHGAYVTPYLRKETLRRNLVEPVHKGRIWRIVPDNWQAPEPIKLSKASTTELIDHLSHEDGWFRDTAQRILIERGDEAAIPLLRNASQFATSAKGRLHALWTLNGLGDDLTSTFLKALGDDDPTVQSAALRITEQLSEAQPGIMTEVSEAFRQRWEVAAPEVLVQLALTAGSIEQSDKIDLLSKIITKYVDQPVVRDAVMSSLHNTESAFMEAIWGAPDWQIEDANRAIFIEMLTSAIVRNNDSDDLDALLTTAKQAQTMQDWRAEPILTSLSLFADIESNQANPKKTERALDAETQATFALGRQYYLSSCAGCHGTNGAGLPRFAPPLVQSEWVLGNEEVLVRLVLHGLEGPIEVNGTHYDAPDILPVMPGHSPLDDQELSAILTYIRLAWGHQAMPIARRTVGRIRHGSQGRVFPWTAEELQSLSFE